MDSKVPKVSTSVSSDIKQPIPLKFQALKALVENNTVWYINNLLHFLKNSLCSNLKLLLHLLLPGYKRPITICCTVEDLLTYSVKSIIEPFLTKVEYPDTEDIAEYFRTKHYFLSQILYYSKESPKLVAKQFSETKTVEEANGE